MEDNALISLSETLRRHYIAAHADRVARHDFLGAAQWKGKSSAWLYARAVAFAMGVAPSQGNWRDELRGKIQGHPLGVWLEDGGRFAHVAEATTGLNKKTTQADRLMKWLAKTPAQSDSAESLSDALAACATPADAVAWCKKNLPISSENSCRVFLSEIGYDLPVADPGIVRFLNRYGALPPGPQDETWRAERLIDRTARVTQLTAPQVAYQFSLHAGAAGNCMFTRQCASCPVSSNCNLIKTAGMPEEKTTPARTTIRNWTAEERPRERMLAGERLSTAELIAVLIGSGTPDRSALDVARIMLERFETLQALAAATPREIQEKMKGCGIGPARAVEICAALELGRRATGPAADPRGGLKAIGNSADVFQMFRAKFMTATQEEFLMLALNTKNRVQKVIDISKGTLNYSIVHPRDVFKEAMRESAHGVIFVHNHPSGDPTPSPEDFKLTSRLMEVGELVGIKVLDHIIIGAQGFYSFADSGRLR